MLYFLYVLWEIFCNVALTEFFALITWNLLLYFKESKEPIRRTPYLVLIQAYCFFITQLVCCQNLNWKLSVFLVSLLILMLVYIIVCLEFAQLSMKRWRDDGPPSQLTGIPTEIVLPPKPLPLILQYARFLRFLLPSHESSQGISVDDPYESLHSTFHSNTNRDQLPAIIRNGSSSSGRTESFMTADGPSVFCLNNEFLGIPEENEINELPAMNLDSASMFPLNTSIGNCQNSEMSLFILRKYLSSIDQHTNSSNVNRTTIFPQNIEPLSTPDSSGINLSGRSSRNSSLNMHSPSVFPPRTDSIDKGREIEMILLGIKNNLSSFGRCLISPMNLDNAAVSTLNANVFSDKEESELRSTVRSNPSSAGLHTISSMNVDNASAYTPNAHPFCGTKENEINELSSVRSYPSSSAQYTIPSAIPCSVNADATPSLAQTNSSEDSPDEMEVSRTRSGTIYKRIVKKKR